MCGFLDVVGYVLCSVGFLDVPCAACLVADFGNIDVGGKVLEHLLVLAFRMSTAIYCCARLEQMANITIGALCLSLFSYFFELCFGEEDVFCVSCLN